MPKTVPTASFILFFFFFLLQCDYKQYLSKLLCCQILSLCHHICYADYCLGEAYLLDKQ